MKFILPSIFIFAVFFISCATQDPVDDPEQIVVEEPAVEVQPEPEPEPEPEVVVEGNDGYVVTQEIYNQTFEEIEALIYQLNSVISERKYDRWLKYLSSIYKRTYNSGDILNEINQYPQLKDNGIVLTGIKDYFDWVVVPSRSQAVLDEIVFVGETQVVAYSSFDGKRAKLYELEKIDEEWKITVW